MARYIDAELARKTICAHINQLSADFIDTLLLLVPTADVEEVRHGEWIEEQAQHVVYRLKNRAFWVKYICPFCGKKNGRYKSNYCPKCGAKMGGEKE